MDQFKKGLKVLGALMLLGQKERMARSQVEAAEHGAPGVLAADGNRRRLAPTGPTRPQGRQQQQVGFVQGQEHGPGAQGPDLAANPAFFSLAAGPGAARSGSASTHNRAPAVGAGEWPPTSVARVGRRLAIAAARAPSSPCRRSQSRWAAGSAPALSGPPGLGPNAGDAPGRLDGAAPRRWLGDGSARSNAARCADPPAAAGQLRRPDTPHRLPTTPGCAERGRHHGPELTHVPTFGVAQGAGAMFSSATLTPATADRNPFNAALILHVHLARLYPFSNQADAAK